MTDRTDMTITLFSHHLTTPTPIAMPAFRVCAALDGALSDDANKTCASDVFEAFLDNFGPDIAYAATSGKSRWTPKLVKPTATKLKRMREVIANGFTTHTGMRLYGPDTNVLGKPAVPFLSITQVYPTFIVIDLAVPHDHPDRDAFAQASDHALRSANLMAGYQGFGFFKSPISGLADNNLPVATDRFRAATMTEWMGNPSCTLWSPRTAGNWPGYEAGITELGWRTYVGRMFTDRITAAPAASLTIEDLPNMKIVTAGPAPIWGDVNADEDITAYKDAYAYLAPVFTSRDMLRSSTLGGIPSYDPARAAVVDGYLNRFA